jgi:hypothetical protein
MTRGSRQNGGNDRTEPERSLRVAPDGAPHLARRRHP